MKKTKKPHVWIVEMKAGAHYVPTVGCALTLSDALIAIAEWRDNCPNDLFRIGRYSRTVLSVARLPATPPPPIQ